MDHEIRRVSMASEERLRTELRTTLATFHELGPDYEQQIVDAFIERVSPIVNEHPIQPDGRRMARRERRQRRRFIGLAVVAVFGVWLIAGHAFGSPHHAHRVSPGFGGAMVSPWENPAIPPAPPQPPQPPMPPSIQ